MSDEALTAAIMAKNNDVPYGSNQFPSGPTKH